MTDNADAVNISLEAVTNRRYLKAIEKKIKRMHATTRQMSRSRSSQWTGTGEAKVHAPEKTALFGRVRLDHDDPDTGTDFYIGSWYTSDPTVFSWAAPVAATFFADDERSHELVSSVVVRRSFTPDGLEITDYTDDWVKPGEPGEAAFVEPDAIKIPKAPGRAGSALGRLTGRKMPPGTPEVSSTTHSEKQRSASKFPAQPLQKEQRSSPGKKPARQAIRRAADAVRKAVRQPKKSQLAPLLATLQPDQYELVTADPRTSLVIQGHPGTGKTVIASHRAAYLTHSEREAEPLRRVLVLGPTEEWVRHVSGVTSALDSADTIRVLAISTRLRKLAKYKGNDSAQVEGHFMDTDWSVGELVAHTVESLRPTQTQIQEGAVTEETFRRIYEAIRTNEANNQSLTTDPDLVGWLSRLPAFSAARKHPRYIPLFAACSVALTATKGRPKYDHIIVDEAQDLRPLEWWIVAQNNNGRYTLVGDVNQRRSDHTHSSWELLDADIRLDDQLGAFRYEELSLGYRSTSEILQFAGQLLPKSAKSVDAIQDGAEIRCEKVPPAEREDSAIWHATDFCSLYEGGQVAIITAHPYPVIGALKDAGWRGASASDHAWSKGSHTISLLSPENARGLEFDAVVVIEPADFPKNLGRSGPLYTSLTRANKELAVIHSKPLPGNLRYRK